MGSYSYNIDVGADSVASRVVNLVGADKRVLELGCSGGHMSRILQARGCDVTGIEIDAAAAEGAKEYCSAVHTLGLDDPTWSARLARADDKFDVIVAADVLEHLRDPFGCLVQMRSLLNAAGYLVVSTPNIAYGGVIASLLVDEFEYKEIGLLDSTHRHFFTLSSLRKVLSDAGYRIDHLSSVDAGLDHPEFARQWAGIPERTRNLILRKPGALAFQFVATAHKAPREAAS